MLLATLRPGKVVRLKSAINRGRHPPRGDLLNGSSIGSMEKRILHEYNGEEPQVRVVNQ